MMNLKAQQSKRSGMLLKVIHFQWIILFLCVNFAFGAELTPEEIAERLQGTYEKTKSLTADFRQVTIMQGSQRRRLGNGTMVILKPGRIRWDYQTPDHQVLVSDGEKFFMYFAKAEQMIVRPINEYVQSDVTYSFFAGSGNIVHDFSVFPPEVEDEQGTYGIKLIPKEVHPQVDYLHIWVTKDAYMIQRMQIVDQFGTITDLYFKNIKINQEIDPKFFSFTPPPDTEIILQ